MTRTTQHPVFARRLAEARKRAGLSQRQLGVLAELDPTVASPRINQYERGKHEPQLKTAKRLAEVLGRPGYRAQDLEQRTRDLYAEALRDQQRAVLSAAAVFLRFATIVLFAVVAATFAVILFVSTIVAVLGVVFTLASVIIAIIAVVTTVILVISVVLLILIVVHDCKI